MTDFSLSKLKSFTEYFVRNWFDPLESLHKSFVAAYRFHLFTEYPTVNFFSFVIVRKKVLQMRFQSVK